MPLQHRKLLAVGHVKDRDRAIMRHRQQAPVPGKRHGPPHPRRRQFDLADDPCAPYVIDRRDMLLGTDERQVLAVFAQVT